MTNRAIVVIAGGGIGGLALGTALRRRIGADVTVVERAAQIEDVGSGLVLYPNAMKALDAIGGRLGTAVRTVGHLAGPGETRPVLSPDADVLADDPVGELGQCFGAPQVSLMRSALQRALAAEAADAGVILRTGVQVHDHTDLGDRVEVVLADGRTLHADLLVGADGINSGVRRRLLDDGPPSYCGFTTLRGTAAAPVGLSRGFVIKGRGVDLFAAPVGGGRLYWTAKINAMAGVWPAKERAAALADLLKLVAGWHGPVGDLIRGTDPAGLVVTDIADREPVEVWSRGRVTLLGDAAHPMTPALGQGAGMALEDAAVLAGCLRAAGLRAAQPTEPADRMAVALLAYAARRAPRTAAAVRLSRLKGPAGDSTGFSTRDERLADLFAWRPPAGPDT